MSHRTPWLGLLLRSLLPWPVVLLGAVAIEAGVGCGPGWSLSQSLAPSSPGVAPAQSQPSPPAPRSTPEIGSAQELVAPALPPTQNTIAAIPAGEALDWAARAQTAAALRSGAPPSSAPVASDPAPLLADASTPAPAIADPDLGIIRVRPTAPNPSDASAQTIADPDLGIIRVRPTPGDAPTPTVPSTAGCDAELGCLRLRQPPLPAIATPGRNPVVFVLARVDYFRSSNVFSSNPPQADSLTRPGVTLYAAPAIGPNTYVVASATGNLLRYADQPRVNSNELFFRAGIVQRLSPNMFGEIGWSNQQLFISGDKIAGIAPGTRYYNDHAIRAELSRRDRFSDKLSLNSFYQFHYSFTDPTDRSRLTHALSLSLNYDVQPNLQLGLDYQLAVANYTRQQRQDLYNQVLGRLSYTALRNTQISVFLGYTFGRSTDQTVSFNGLLWGVSLSATLGLF